MGWRSGRSSSPSVTVCFARLFVSAPASGGTSSGPLCHAGSLRPRPRSIPCAHPARPARMAVLGPHEREFMPRGHEFSFVGVCARPGALASFGCAMLLLALMFRFYLRAGTLARREACRRRAMRPAPGTARDDLNRWGRSLPWPLHCSVVNQERRRGAGERRARLRVAVIALQEQPCAPTTAMPSPAPPPESASPPDGAAYQRSVRRNCTPCSDASSFAGSRRAPSRLMARCGASDQRAPARHVRSPASASPRPA